MVELFLIGILLELGLFFVPPMWQYKKFSTALPIAALGFWTGLFVTTQWDWVVFIMLVVSFYRLFNLMRVGKDRVHGSHLLNTVRRTSCVLVLLHAALYGVFASGFSIGRGEFPVTLATAQLACGLVVLGVTARNLLKTKHHMSKYFYSDKELPTVTVAIPARNETADLASCLESIVSNNYPKLEVLVLDDCSLDRTPEIIRDFAHDGVRFIEGKPPKNHWLAKNQAYQQLSDAASGELILFCGVDVRMGPETIRSLVTTLLNKQRDMLSIMPYRIGGGVRTAFIQPLRYWWEIALPRRFFNRPPVLSTCWLIRRASLKKLGGFAAVSQNIAPEAYFARELVQTDGYAFARADEHLDLRTVKGVEAQLATAIRTRYPQLRKRPENVLILSTALLVFMLTPYVMVVHAFWSGFGPAEWIALLACGLFTLTHYLVISASNPANNLISLFNFPFVVMTELVLLHISMYRYEFASVQWKGRNVCLPVMRTVSHLPPIH